MNIYVGNLSFDTVEDDLRQAFEAYGEVTNVNIVKNRDTGQSRGFGFIEMATDEEGKTAIEEMNGVDLHGRTLNVNEARPRTERPSGGGGFRRGGRSGGGGGGRRF